MVLFAVVAVRQPSLVTFGLLSLSIAVATLVIISRVYIVSLQDRIIRTEMHARLLRLGRDRDLARLSIKQITASASLQTPSCLHCSTRRWQKI
jgi:hypothetical protein